MKLLSVCIPTYEMHGLGDKFLTQSFDMLKMQTFQDFEVIISDHSKTNIIKMLCDKYADKLDIKYYKNEQKTGSSSANINNAIQKATGKIIKILFQDDFLYNYTALEEIAKNFDLQKDFWLVTPSIQSKDGINFYRPVYPKYNDETILEKNTISSPSVLSIRNDNPILFDENLIWWMDSDYYKRCYQLYGQPKILNEINVVNRVGDHQITNTLISENLREREYKYILQKFNIKHKRTLLLIAKKKKYTRVIKKLIKKII